MSKLANNPRSLLSDSLKAPLALVEIHYAGTIKTPDAIASRLAMEFAFRRLSPEGAADVLRAFLRPEVGSRCVHEPAAMAELSKLIVARVQAEATDRQMRERRIEQRQYEQSPAPWPKGGMVGALKQRKGRAA